MEQTWQPKVSVVMCTYNGEQFLREQMDSILAQTYPIAEFLIFDDGSLDKTRDIIAGYAARYPVISFHKNEKNIGYNLNFEQALKAAQYEVIAIADQDDVWHHQKIELMIAAWSKESPLIHCDSQRFEKEVPTENRHRKLYHRFKGTNIRQLFVFNSISGHALMMRKSFLPLILPLEKDIYYDWWAAVVATCHGGVDFIDRVLVYQRVHHKNVSIVKDRSEQEKITGYRKEMARHIKKFLTLPQLTKPDRKMAEQLYDFMSNAESNPKKWAFFLFILRHRKTFFYIKQRKVGIFSHIKHAFRWAFY